MSVVVPTTESSERVGLGSLAKTCRPGWPGQTSLSRDLDAQIVTGVMRGPLRRVPAGSFLYRVGDDQDWVALIRKGWTKTMEVSAQGKWCLVSLEGPGSVLGTLKDPQGGSVEEVICKTDVAISVIPRADFERFLASPHFGPSWHAHVVSTVAERQRMLVSFVTLDSERRLAATLIQLAKRWGTPHENSVFLRCCLTHEELGQMVGTTRSRVGLFLNNFQANGMLRKHREGMSLNTEVLAHYVDS